MKISEQKQTKRLKSPRIFKTEGNRLLYQPDQNKYFTDSKINDCLQLSSFQRCVTRNHQRNLSELHEKQQKIQRISYSHQGKEKERTYVESLIKLNKTKQLTKIPARSRKQLWHNYTNTDSSILSVPERRMKSQLHINKTEELYNKYRSTSSLYTEETKDPIQLSLQFAYKSKQGQLATNANKVNQDIAVCQPNLINDINLFFVCDGHGQNGHHVSNYVKEQLPKLLHQNQAFQFLIKETLEQSIRNVAINVNKNGFDTQFSGTTLSGIILENRGKLHCFNIGDSRTILAKYQGNGKFRPYPLSTDHKPSLQREQVRIKQNGGRVDTFRDQNGNPIGPMRVWVNGAQYPGLAMSRSIGDQIAQSVGVSSVPDIREYQLEQNDKFLILASDGVWEFLDNQTVVDIVGRYYLSRNINGACEELLRTAYRMWTIEDDSVIDDITFIIIFLQN